MDMTGEESEFAGVGYTGGPAGGPAVLFVLLNPPPPPSPEFGYP